MKDNFSTQSNQYAKYRPVYPKEFYDYLDGIVKNKETAWDCATGNGQVAMELAKRFRVVCATDISAAQLAQAQQLQGICYSIQPAEKTNFPDDCFDLVTVAQAIHWFDFEKFYVEMKRTAKPNAMLVVMGYGKIEVTPEIDSIINNFYKNTIGSYWDKERKYIDELYKTIPFPFEEIKTPSFFITYNWTLDHFMGYLGTWSAVKHYINDKGQNPLHLIQNQLKDLWENDSIKKIRFPLLLRIGITQ